MNWVISVEMTLFLTTFIDKNLYIKTIHHYDI